jgi:hypothetical protein
MADDAEPVYVETTATCHTAGCGNADIPIPVYVVEGAPANVTCGVCGNPITDLAG